MKVILINGPKRSGKNTAATALAALIPGSVIIGFSHHLKRFTHSIYFGAEGWAMDPDAFDAVKEDPQPGLGHMTWRQVYIHYSENVIKPLHGKEWFGHQFMRAARASEAPVVIVPDSGFREEAEAAVKAVGAENAALIRLYREGCTFAGDSRGYIRLDRSGVAEDEVINVSGDPARMVEDLARSPAIRAIGINLAAPA